jgi:hypothetical protein
MNYNPLIINLYGAPGSGKSTGGAYIYSELKMRGVNVRMFWNEETEDEGALDNFDRGIASLATSYIEQLTINYCPDVIINTYPLGQIAMCSMDLVDTYYDTIIDSNQRNYLLLRVKPYRGDGRNHTEEESDEIQSVTADHQRSCEAHLSFVFLLVCKFCVIRGIVFVHFKKPSFAKITLILAQKKEKIKRLQNFLK